MSQSVKNLLMMIVIGATLRNISPDNGFKRQIVFCRQPHWWWCKYVCIHNMVERRRPQNNRWKPKNDWDIDWRDFRFDKEKWLCDVWKIIFLPIHFWSIASVMRSLWLFKAIAIAECNAYDVMAYRSRYPTYHTAHMVPKPVIHILCRFLIHSQVTPITCSLSIHNVPIAYKYVCIIWNKNRLASPKEAKYSFRGQKHMIILVLLS